MTLRGQPYAEQTQAWPSEGRHVLAQHDAETVVVYQAFRPSIAEFAVRAGRFGGEFSLTRMSWIKPNFLWMMYRSAWATKEGQERVLAVRRRGATDADRRGSRLVKFMSERSAALSRDTVRREPCRAGGVRHG